MAYKLVCIVPLHGYKRGQEVTDAGLVERFMGSHDHHFVKVACDDPVVDEPGAVEEPVTARPTFLPVVAAKDE